MLGAARIGGHRLLAAASHERGLLQALRVDATSHQGGACSGWPAAGVVADAALAAAAQQRGVATWRGSLDSGTSAPAAQRHPSAAGLFSRGFVTPKLAGAEPGTSGRQEGAAAPQPAAGRRQKGAAQTPAVIAQRQQLRVAPISPNLLAEPFRGEPPPLPWTAWLTPAGWRQRWRRLLGSVKSVYTVAKCRRGLPGFELAAFKTEALRLYIDVNRALAAADRGSLRHLVTPGELTNAKRQLRAREEGGWARVDWSLAEQPPLGDLELVHGRLLALDPKNDSFTFAQLTVRFSARHRFVAYDARGRRAAGDWAAAVPVQDVWVFERSLQKAAHSRWRLAGRLAGVPPAPRPAGWRQRLRGLLRGKG